MRPDPGPYTCIATMAAADAPDLSVETRIDLRIQGLVDAVEQNGVPQEMFDCVQKLLADWDEMLGVLGYTRVMLPPSEIRRHPL
jgi:hypothetical protein